MMLSQSKVAQSACQPRALRALTPRVGSLRPRQPTQQPLHHTSTKRNWACAAQTPAEKQDDAVLRYARSIGLPTEEGVFGFTPFAELR